jgi:hypothetical protein
MLLGYIACNIHAGAFETVIVVTVLEKFAKKSRPFPKKASA